MAIPGFKLCVLFFSIYNVIAKFTSSPVFLRYYSVVTKLRLMTIHKLTTIVGLNRG